MSIYLQAFGGRCLIAFVSAYVDATFSTRLFPAFKSPKWQVSHVCSRVCMYESACRPRRLTG